MTKRLLTISIMLLAAMTFAKGQTGTWSGKLDVQGTKLSLVFHLDGDQPTMDSPDQGAKGIADRIVNNIMRSRFIIVVT